MTELAEAIEGAVGTVIDGKPDEIRTVLTVLLAEGHILLEDVPGVGKTQLARAFAAEHWTELYVGMVEHDGLVLEGFIDLLFRDADGSLVIVDYKTDTVTDADALAQRAAHYAPQLRAYARALQAATGDAARMVLIFLDGSGAAGRVVSVARHHDDAPVH